MACNWDALMFLAMMYPGIPGLVGLLGSVAEAIAMIVILALRKEKSASIGAQTQYWFLIITLASA